MSENTNYNEESKEDSFEEDIFKLIEEYEYEELTPEKKREIKEKIQTLLDKSNKE